VARRIAGGCLPEATFDLLAGQVRVVAPSSPRALRMLARGNQRIEG
jgi:hypothetical protein